MSEPSSETNQPEASQGSEPSSETNQPQASQGSEPSSETNQPQARRYSLASQAESERLREMADRLIPFLTSPEFLEQTRWVFEAPQEQRLQVASQRLSVDALRGMGLNLPPGIRLSSRYFEGGWPAAVELGDYPGGRANPINQWNADLPGALDRLRQEYPEAFWRLAMEGRDPTTLQLGTTGPVGVEPRMMWGGCAGAAGWCAGYST